MNYRHLGKAGIQVSELSFGSWVTFHNQVDIDTTMRMMEAAYDAGVNFFDNAEVYAGGKSEEIMGEALRRLGWRRGSYLVSTKLYWGMHDNPNERNTLNRKYLLEAIDGSLGRFGLDYVDLLFCHRADPTTPVEETVWAMHNIIERGKALYWGTSEWEAAEILEASGAKRAFLNPGRAPQPAQADRRAADLQSVRPAPFRTGLPARLRRARLRFNDVESAGLRSADWQVPVRHSKRQSRRARRLRLAAERAHRCRSPGEGSRTRTAGTGNGCDAGSVFAGVVFAEPACEHRVDRCKPGRAGAREHAGARVR